MRNDKESQVVLITGALTGIGRATALAFARDNARVVVSGRHEKEGGELAAKLRALGTEAEFVRADVRNEEDVRALIDKTVERFERLDVAINNAGTYGKAGPITEQTRENYSDVFDTNVLGVLLSLKHEMRVMCAQRHGSIINVSSVVGHIGIANTSVYAASKHAVDGLTESVALEAAPYGVRVNGIAPGPVDTPMLNRTTNKIELQERVALKRIAKPEEIAEVVKFVASDKASYVTGATVSVDGGRFAA